MKDLWQYLKEASKPIVLYGMGNGAEKILDILENMDIQVSGIFASDGFVKPKVFRGFTLESYSDIKKRLGSMIVLVAFGSARSEVLENIKRISLEQELYVPEVAVYGGGLFNLEYAKENKERLERVYNLLADDLSRKTFSNLVYYKISGNPEYLYSCEVSPDEAYYSFLELSGNETFVDLGAYNGDTVLDFISRVNSQYSKIYALEPDKKSFNKLLKNTEDIANIERINACVSDFVGKTSFSMKGGRNSSIGEGTPTDCTTVDAILGGNKATLIKYDVEGEEIAAIRGSKNTIVNYKPKLQIAAYHRTEDIFAIPEEILSFKCDYKIYLRHNPYLPAWDTNYFFI